MTGDHEESDTDVDRADQIADNSAASREAITESIVAAADLRDAEATARDLAADRRDMAATLDAFVHSADDADAFDARKLSRTDRLRSKADRVASASDRRRLGGDAGDSSAEPTAGERAEPVVPDPELTKRRRHPDDAGA